MNEPAGKERVDLGEHLPDERKRARLAWREHVSVRRLSEGRIDLVLQHMVQVTERFLFRDDVDVIVGCVRDELFHISVVERTARRRDQRIRVISERVLEVGGEEVDLIRGERPDLFFLEVERRHRAT